MSWKKWTQCKYTMRNKYHANFYSKYEKHDYHVINIIDVEWCVLPTGSNHHFKLMDCYLQINIFQILNQNFPYVHELVILLWNIIKCQNLH